MSLDELYKEDNAGVDDFMSSIKELSLVDVDYNICIKGLQVGVYYAQSKIPCIHDYLHGIRDFSVFFDLVCIKLFAFYLSFD